MIAGDALLDAFINANILLFVGLVLWHAVRLVMRSFGLRRAFGTELRLLNAVFLAIACAPIIAMLFQQMQSTGVARGVNINLSDAVVAYYLNGGFQMESSRFETLVLMRDTFMLNVLNADGWIARAAIVLFLGGLALGVFRLAVSVVSLWTIVRHSYAWRKIGRVRLHLSDRTLVPFSTRGLRNYYIVLPSHLLAQQDELKVAIAHELQHIRQGDLEWEIVLEALKPLFILNPAYSAWKRQVEHLRELNCDSEVLSRGRIKARTYCDTLLSVCQKTLRRDRAFVMAVPKVALVTADRSALFQQKQSFLERRILTALDGRRPRAQKLWFVFIALPLLVTVSFVTIAIQTPGDWSHDRLMLSTVVNLDRLDEINRLSTFGRVRN
ncbi:MAG: M56 family metallopeptidase [Pseudomonadota bacterium]